MIKLAIFFLLFFGYHLGYSQTYKIMSFEGKLIEVNLSQKLFSKTLKVSCFNDTLHFSDCTGVEKVETLGNNFLKIVYNLRGGTGLDLRNTLVLSVSHQKIYVSLLLQSYVGSLIDTIEYVYESQVKLSGNSPNDFKMMVHTHGDRKIGSGIIEKNVNAYLPLRFDKTRKVFFSSYQTVSRHLFIYDLNTQNPKKIFVNGYLPVISLNKDIYYYVNGKWYENDIYNVSWLKYYYR